MLRVAVAVCLCCSLSGCWFVFIPGSLIQSASDAVTGAEGQHCVAASTKIGDKLRDPASGRTAIVKSLSGSSSRCTDQAMPVRALVEFT